MRANLNKILTNINIGEIYESATNLVAIMPHKHVYVC